LRRLLRFASKATYVSERLYLRRFEVGFVANPIANNKEENPAW